MTHMRIIIGIFIVLVVAAIGWFIGRYYFVDAANPAANKGMMGVAIGGLAGLIIGGLYYYMSADSISNY